MCQGLGPLPAPPAIHQHLQVLAISLKLAQQNLRDVLRNERSSKPFSFMLPSAFKLKLNTATVILQNAAGHTYQALTAIAFLHDLSAGTTTGTLQESRCRSVRLFVQGANLCSLLIAEHRSVDGSYEVIFCKLVWGAYITDDVPICRVDHLHLRVHNL